MKILIILINNNTWWFLQIFFSFLIIFFLIQNDFIFIFFFSLSNLFISIPLIPSSNPKKMNLVLVHQSKPFKITWNRHFEEKTLKEQQNNMNWYPVLLKFFIWIYLVLETLSCVIKAIYFSSFKNMWLYWF